MKVLNKIKEINNFPLILFFVMLINYLPLFINNAFTKESRAVSMIIMVLCFALECAILMFFYLKNRKDFIINKKKVIVLGIVLISMFLMQTINLIRKEFFIMDIFNIGCIAINIFLLYIIIYNFKTDEIKIKTFFKGVFYIAIIAIIYNVILFGKEILNNLGIINLKPNPYGHNIKSFFANRNSLSFFIYISLISNAFITLFENENKKYKMSLLLILFGAWSTYSKTGWTIAIIFLEMFFILNDNYTIKKRLLICAIIAIIGIGGFLNITGSNLINHIFGKKVTEETMYEVNYYKRLSGRTDIWKMGFEVLNESPINYILGVGRFKSVDNLVFKNQRFTQFHNVYLDILLTGGLVQLIYTGFIYLSVIIKVVKSKMNKNFKRTYIIMLVTYAAYIMMESCGRFSIGAVDTLCMIFFITIPILHANSCTEIDEKEGNKKWLL